MATPIDRLLSISVTSLKRIGYLRPDSRQAGTIHWSQGHGPRVASMGVVTDTTFEVATVEFVYTDPDGRQHDDFLLLRWKRSNLDKGGFYYFVCPVTGRSCRKLYLIGGRFVSRYAFNAPYRSQTVGPAGRRSLFYLLAKYSKFEDLAAQPHRKETYRGKLTPYGRKLEKMGRRVWPAVGLLISEANKIAEDNARPAPTWQ